MATINHFFQSDKQIIQSHERLEDSHMSYFGYLLHKVSHYSMQETYCINCLESIKPVRRDLDHIQIMYSADHWVCSYYDTKEICIYDSMNKKKLYLENKLFLQKLFPHLHIDESSIRFPTIQQQHNGVDCGVYAISFAVSLLYGLKPENIKYNRDTMRQHLIDIFESQQITHFPQDTGFGTPTAVLPLPLVLEKRYRSMSRCPGKMVRPKESQNVKQGTLSTIRDNNASTKQHLSAINDRSTIRHGSLSAISDNMASRKQSLSAISDNKGSRKQNLSAISDTSIIRHGSLSAISDTLNIKHGSLSAISDNKASRKQNLPAINDTPNVMHTKLSTVSDNSEFIKHTLSAVSNTAKMKQKPLFVRPDGDGFVKSRQSAIKNTASVKQTNVYATSNAASVKRSALFAISGSNTYNNTTFALTTSNTILSKSTLLAVCDNVMRESFSAINNNTAFEKDSSPPIRDSIVCNKPSISRTCETTTFTHGSLFVINDNSLSKGKTMTAVNDNKASKVTHFPAIDTGSASNNCTFAGSLDKIPPKEQSVCSDVDYIRCSNINPTSVKCHSIPSLNSDEVAIIECSEWLSDKHISQFHKVLQASSTYYPRDTLLVQCPELIDPVSPGVSHIQILYSSSHWLCTYYDTRSIYIYMIH